MGYHATVIVRWLRTGAAAAAGLVAASGAGVAVVAAQVAKFFMSGRSEWEAVFRRPPKRYEDEGAIVRRREP